MKNSHANPAYVKPDVERQAILSGPRVMAGSRRTRPPLLKNWRKKNRGGKRPRESV
jgi:hypothetical protein